MGLQQLLILLSIVRIAAGQDFSSSGSFPNATTPSVTSPATFTAPPNCSPSSYDLKKCPEFPNNNCCREGDPGYVGLDWMYSPWDLDNPFHESQPSDADTVAGSQCAAVWTSQLSKWLETQAVTSYLDPGFTTTTLQAAYDWPDGSFSFTGSEPCCSSCTLRGGHVEVMIWPTPAPSPAVATLIDANNYTFVSPSIYVVFQSLAATDNCGPIGGTYINKTVAFERSELETTRYIHGSTSDLFCRYIMATTTWLPFDYRSVEAGNCEDVLNTDGDVGSTGIGCSWNPCSPYISVPTQVFSIDPAFAQCTDGIYAFIDPPHTLTQGNGLRPFSSPPSEPVQTTPASPVQTGDPGLPTKTPSSPINTLPTAPAENTQPADPQPSNDPPVNNPPPTNDPAPTPDPPNNTPSPSPNNSDPSPTVFVPVPGQTFTQDSKSELVHASQTIVPGGPAVTISGTVFSLPPAGTAIVVDGTDHLLVPSPTGHLETGSGGNAIFVIGTETITGGAAATTIGGTVYSLPPSGDYIVVDGSTAALPGKTPLTSEPYYVVGTQTLTPGGAITVSGTVVSLLPGGATVVVGGVTEPIGSILGSSTTGGIGGAIVSLGGFIPAPTGGNGTQPFLGVGSRERARLGSIVVVIWITWVII